MECKELLRRCASSDAGAWSLFIDRFGERVEIGVRRVLREAGLRRVPSDVQDFVQEVYLRLYAGRGRVLSRFRGSTKEEASSYLGRLAENVTRDRLRRARAGKRFFEAPGLPLGRWAMDLPDVAQGPEERFLRTEWRQQFLRCCREVLPAHALRRNTWILERAFLDGWSSREIAMACRVRIAVASVNSLISRTRRRLAARGFHLPERDRR
jgi:RNA polymerase sigma factor (sigma-70 family)